MLQILRSSRKKDETGLLVSSIQNIELIIMKERKTHILSVMTVIVSTVTLMACHKETNVIYESGNSRETDDIEIGIPKGNVTLTEVDAATVAKLYLKNKVATKTVAPKTIKNVVTIPDDFGEPAIYAINFDDGFVWVSATKKLCPILAVVEHGTFSLEDSKVGIELIKQEYLQMIRQSEVTDSIRRLWHQYEESVCNSEVRTRTSSEFEDELANLKEYAWEEGYKVYRLSDAADNDMPQGIINGFEDIACDACAGTSFDGGEYDYTQTAYVLERNFERELQYGPLTSTKWNQTSPYNSLVPGEKLLGCVTVATAQYMRFNKRPAYYQTEDDSICYWHNMPNNSSNATLSKFLADLRQRLDINDNGSGSVYDIVPLLNTTFGYNAEIYDYNISRLDYPLSINKVVMLRGVTADNKGHVWICDGLRYQVFGGVEYNLYVLDHLKYPNFDYVNIKTELDDTYKSPVPYCHMNWGWGGDYDGWYYGSDWNTGNGNLVKDRKMIY